MVVYFIIPVFNESDNLYILSENLKKCLPGKEKFFLFVDDCSTDNSVSLLHKYFENEFNYSIFTKERNIGPGHSFNYGFNWVVNHSKSENDIVVTMEADNTSDIILLDKMISISNVGFDIVLASVYAQGGGFDKTSSYRKLISFIANMLFRAFFNIKILTLSSFYRVYRINILKIIKERYLSIISETGFICMLEILLKSVESGASIIEVPMVLSSKNRKGKSKMKVLYTAWQYLKFYFTYKPNKH